MLSQADLQRTLALALGEFGPAWKIVGDCGPVDPLDPSHWDSGSQSFQVTLRHRVTGHLKVLGRRVAYEPTASVHHAVAFSLIDAYRHGNAEPIRRYLEDIGVAATAAGDATHFFRRPSAASSSFEPTELLAAGMAVVAPASAVSTLVSGDTDVESPAPHSGVSRSWSLIVGRPRWPARLTVAPRRRRQTPRAAARTSGTHGIEPGETAARGRPARSRRYCLRNASNSSPNVSHFSPLNFASCSCSMGAKSVGLVLILTPDSSSGSSRFLTLAAWRMMFSRDRSLPHCLRTWVIRMATL